MWNFLLILTISAISLSHQASISDQVKDHAVEVKDSHFSMYDAILQKCPNIANTSIANHTELQSCTDWAKINATNKFSEDTLPNLRCLLFYDTLVAFCTEAGEFLKQSPTMLDDRNMKIHKNLSLAKVCDKSVGLFKGREHNLLKIVTDSDCYGICIDYKTHVSINNFCLKAYYFVTFDLGAFKSRILEILNSQANLKQHKVEPKESLSQNGTPDKENLATEKIINKHLAGDNPVMDTDRKGANKVGQIVDQNDAQEEVPEEKAAQQNAVIADNQPVINPVQKDANKEGNVKVEREEGEVAEMVKPSVKPVQNLVEGSNPLLPDDVTPDEVKKPSTPLHKPSTLKPNAEILKVEPIESNINVPVKDEDFEDIVDKKEKAVVENNNANVADVDGDNDDDNVNNEDYNKLNLDNVKGKVEEVKKVITKPEALENDSLIVSQQEITDGDSSFFSYFMASMCLCIVGYVGYHNRHKLIGLLLEGRQRGKRPGRGGRRPNSANYHKLDSNLEEALSSSVRKSSSNIIY